ncbi:MAG: phosphate acyltransferase PlsX [Ignavibacteria bacterium]|nr:phosphate acyltransferase PlsX [Ignavibacteria bacterium]
MGGDYAPDNQILGAAMAAKALKESIAVTLVGKEKVIKELLNKEGIHLDNLNIENADEVITMSDVPSETYKTKPNSSLAVAVRLQKEKKSDGFVSAGNTGAVLANSLLRLGRIEGIDRPTIGNIFPGQRREVMMFDAGASTDCKPKHLLEFAVMGSLFMSNMLGINNPKVGLLSIGEEKSKGNELTFEAYKLLENSGLNFVGNIEGGDVLTNKVDVVVCDGFVGNIVLKFAESIIEYLKVKFKKYASQGFFKKLWMGMISGTVKNILYDLSYEHYGGVPLLGINGVAIIGHGKSSPLAIKNMILRAEEMVKSRINDKIKEMLKDYKLISNNN